MPLRFSDEQEYLDWVGKNDLPPEQITPPTETEETEETEENLDFLYEFDQQIAQGHPPWEKNQPQPIKQPTGNLLGPILNFLLESIVRLCSLGAAILFWVMTYTLPDMKWFFFLLAASFSLLTLFGAAPRPKSDKPGIEGWMENHPELVTLGVIFGLDHIDKKRQQ